MVQDSNLEELEALPEEAAGGDEDREKEILIERIQSIKEEKQVSFAPFSLRLPSSGRCFRQEHPWTRTEDKLVVGLEAQMPRASLTACAWHEGGAQRNRTTSLGGQLLEGMTSNMVPRPQGGHHIPAAGAGPERL